MNITKYCNGVIINAFYIFIIALSVVSCNETESLLSCCYKTADITPKDSVILAGFAARKGLSTGVHKPLESRCLVIKKGDEKVCIISNDLMETGLSTTDLWREDIAKKSGCPIENIFIHNIHTHSAPRTGGWCAKEGQPNFYYAKEVRETIVNNAVSALSDTAVFVPFTMEIGRGKSDINCNRRDSEGYCSRDCYVVRLIDKKRNPIISMVNYACHPVSLNHKSNVVSPDFPGFAAEILEKVWGGKVMYFSGAAGNSDPCDSLSRLASYAEQKGYKLANDIKDIEFVPVKDNGVFKLVSKEIKLPFAADTITVELIEKHVKEILQWTGVSDTWPKDVKYWSGYIKEDIKNGLVKNYLPFEVHALNLGGTILFFTQGEPFMEYQTVLREAFPDNHVMFIAYTNGQNSYLPSKEAYMSDKYSYETKEMHVYIGAPYPLSDKMPDKYISGICDVTKEALSQ